MLFNKNNDNNKTTKAATNDYLPSWTIENYALQDADVDCASGEQSNQQSAPVLIDADARHDSLLQRGMRVHHLFEQRCRDFGVLASRRHIAVEYEETVYSYSALLKLSRQLARFLKAEGLKSGSCVGLLVDRSIYSHATVLALSAINVSYVPLDPAFPGTRINYILSDCGAERVLTVSTHSEIFNELDARLLVLDQHKDDIDRCSSRPLTSTDAHPRPADSVAYVIYTSGTTGQPKGVPVNHSAICNFLSIARQIYGFSETDRVYQGMSIAFDFSFEESWVPLIAGATLVPASSTGNLLGEDLLDFLRARRISALCCVPTLLATLHDDLPDLRLLLVSGENCPEDLIRKWRRPDRRIINAYGPTETTVTATWSIVDSQRSLTIGGPLPTYSVVILQTNTCRPVKPGQAGEICIAGIGLSTGYLNNPEKTKASFINDFIGIRNNPSRKLYRTGDLGRINADSEIEYLGRIDTQIKIRGYRIELDEIECVIRSEEYVDQVVVNHCIVDLENDNVELVAYVIWTQNLSPAQISRRKTALHNSLSSRLPSYMLPSYYQSIDEIPRLPSNKVDRSALPLPEGPRISVSNKRIVEPINEKEQQLVAILGKLMKVDEISTDADFFTELGANSLLMAQFATALRKENPVNRISMKTLYQHSTVSDLAKVLEKPTVSEVKVDVRKNAHLSTPERTSENPIKSRESETTRITSIQAAKDSVPPNISSTSTYVLCAVLQSACFVLLTFSIVLSALFSYRWIGSAETLSLAYLRTIICGSVIFFGLSASLILVKWLAVGRFDTKPIPIWSLQYVRFWVAKSAIRANPLNIFIGTPLYNFYFRLLGASIGRGSVILSRTPVCMDLLTIGSQTVIRQDTYMQGYRAHAGFIYPGAIDIGSQAFVGDASVLDINSRVGDQAQLGTSSALFPNDRVPEGQCYQGSPARPCTYQFEQLQLQKMDASREVVFTMFQLAVTVLFMLPMPFLFIFVLSTILGMGDTHIAEASATEWSMISTVQNLFSSAVAIYAGSIFFGLLTILTIPRLLQIAFIPNSTHSLYGFQHVVARAITRFSNSRVLNVIFGDSSMVVHYLSAVGYDLSESTQTGSNFGVDQRHHSPFLCKFSRNTLVSDGLMMLNIETSATSFRASKISVPADSYLGNLIHYPPRAKVGENCLIATKAMVPIDGPVREGVGILGSPPFEIPRSVTRDTKFDHYKKPEILAKRLRMKLHSNLITLGIYLVRNVTSIFFSLLIFWQLNQMIGLHVESSIISYAGFLTIVSLISLTVTTIYSIGFERLVLFFSPLKPLYCSLYDRQFWLHERFWKLNYNVFIVLFNGTPFKGILLRLQGVRVGKQVFDDGISITEPGMVTIGDYCVLNYNSSAQCHSLEDGTFKSDRIAIGSRCTVGVRGFIHYGTTIKDDVVVEADAFVMKGSEIDAGRTWIGNPARDSVCEDSEPVGVISIISRPIESIERRDAIAG